MNSSIIILAQKFWEWPEVTGVTVATFFFYIVLFLAIIVITSFFFNKGKLSGQIWTQVLKYAYSKKLNSTQIAILEDFYKHLVGLGEKANLLLDKREFQNSLYAYLTRHKSAQGIENYVQIMDKLFPEHEHHMEINSLNEIYNGEFCCLEVKNTFILGHVVKKTMTELLISTTETHMIKDYTGLDAFIYFYRQELGGYLIGGNIKKIKANGLIFEFDGNIEKKGDEHIHADITRELEFTPWLEHNEMADGATQSSVQAIPVVEEPEPEPVLDENGEPILIPQMDRELLLGRSIKISDRSILFDMIELDMNDILMKKYDIWLLDIKFSLDISLQLKGRIFKSKDFSGKYIFKYISPSGSDLKILYDEIRKFKPERGFVS